MCVQVALMSVHVRSLWLFKPCQLGKVVSKEELLWFGRPPDVSQLGDSDAAITEAGRKKQSDAYNKLGRFVTGMQTCIADCSSSSGFSPADRQLSLRN